MNRVGKVEVTSEGLLPLSIRVAESTWFLSTQQRLELSTVCSNTAAGIIKVNPPLTLVELNRGCEARGKSTGLPEHYQVEEGYLLKTPDVEWANVQLNNLSC